MAAQASNGHINVYEAGDYPIILGDSLKEGHQSKSKFLQLRYNWTPPNDFKGQKGSLKQSNGEAKLTYTGGDAPPQIYAYTGVRSANDAEKDGKENSSLVLVFDEKRSAYVLERISNSFDLNINSASGMSKDEIRRVQQLGRSTSGASTAHYDKSETDDDEPPNASNPYDFRHFFAEAKETAEKTSIPAEVRTPGFGGSTPVARITSPSIGSGRAASSSGNASISASATRPKKGDITASKPKTVKKPAPKKKEITTAKGSQVLSKERISDSDEELSDAPSIQPRKTKAGVGLAISSGNVDRSSHIASNDGGLEIEDGSPPQKPKQRYRIHAETFRSQTHTPVMNASKNTRPALDAYDRDIVMRDSAPDEAEDDTNNVNDDDDEDDNDDVEELELDHPRTRREDLEVIQHADTPPAPVQRSQSEDEDDDDDDDALAAAMFEALEDEEIAGDNRGVSGYGHVDDDESEISEEE